MRDGLRPRAPVEANNESQIVMQSQGKRRLLAALVGAVALVALAVPAMAADDDVIYDSIPEDLPRQPQ